MTNTLKKPGSTGTLTIELPDVEGHEPPQWNDHVRFDAESDAPYPFLRVQGYQNDTKVLESWSNVGTLHTPVFVMSSPAWLSGGAHVIADLVNWTPHGYSKPLASVEFDVLP